MWSSESCAALPPRRVLLRALAAGCSLGLLAGCGFRPRGSALPALPSLALSGLDTRASLRAELLRQMGTEARFAEAPEQAELLLNVLEDREELSVVTITAFAKARELRLVRRVRFEVRARDGRLLVPATEAAQERGLTYNESFALAKEDESREIFRAMERDIATRVLLVLASAAR